MALNQSIIQEVLNREMVPGKRYKVKELIKLFEESEYDFEEWDLEPLDSEDYRPRWHRLVTNSVRLCPGRTDYNDDSWTELRVIKKQRNYIYYKLSNDREEDYLVDNAKEDNGSGTIYSIANEAWGDWIKIGKSIDFTKRLLSYQTYSPLKDYRALHIVDVPNRHVAEGRAHRIASDFSYFEPMGEWFHITKDQAVQTLEQVKKMHQER